MSDVVHLAVTDRAYCGNSDLAAGYPDDVTCVECLRGAVKEALLAMHDARAALQAAEEDRKRFLIERDAARAELNNVRRDHHSCWNKIQRQKENLTALNAKVGPLEVQAKLAKADKLAAEEERDAARATAEKAERESDETHGRMVSFKREALELRRRNNKLNQRLVALQTLVKRKLRPRLRAATDMCMQLHAERDAALAQAEAAELRAEGWENTHNQVKAQWKEAVERAEKAERERDEALRRIASVLDLQLPTNDPVRAIEFDIKRLLDTAERWSQACALALEHCPVGDGESHIRQGIPRLAKECAEAIAERDRLRAEAEALRARVAELEGAGAHEWAKHEREGWTVCSRCGMVRNYDRETPCRGTTPPVAPRDDNDNDNDNESDIIIAGRRVPFVQVGMIVHPDDCLNCERDGSPLWCSALVCDIHDDDETARFGMMATLLFRNGERREEPCDELRRRWRLARDFDQTRVYTGRWGVTPRGSVWPVAEVNEDA